MMDDDAPEAVDNDAKDEMEIERDIAALIDACDFDSTERSERRIRAIEYYNGLMRDLPADEGKSQVVSRDFRSTIGKVMPALMRVFFGSDDIAEFLPVGEGDDAIAEQMTLYFNNVTVKESGLEDALYDAFQDALKHGEGVLKWWWEEKKCVRIETKTGLAAEQVAELEQDAEIQILDKWDWSASLDGQEEATFYGVRLLRRQVERKPRCCAVPLDEFGIHPDAKTVMDAPIIYHRTMATKSDLIARGYDEEMVEGLPIAAPEIDSDQERLARMREDGDTLLGSGRRDGNIEMVEVYECYARIDEDGDGIAELRRIDFVASGINRILFDDYASDVCFEILTPERIEHTLKGQSLFDDLEEIQRVKTVLTRQTLDNLYWQNSPQPTVQEGVINNPDAVMNPQFGLPIRVREGTDARAAVAYNPVPFVAQQSYTMLDRWDAAIVDRTGITSAAAGLDPNSLQNVREQGVQMISDAAAARAWMIARSFAKGVKRVCSGLMRLVVENQDHPRMIRLSGRPMLFDPRGWTLEFDCEPNTGLGTGSRERDMGALTIVAQYQEKILATMGINNPFVKPEHLHNTMTMLVKAAGLRTPSMFFARPEPQEVQALMQPQPSQEDKKLAADKEMKMMEIQVQRDREAAQRDADLAVRAADGDQRERMAQMEFEFKARLEAQRLTFDREKAAMDAAMKEREIEVRREIELLKLGMVETDGGVASEAGVNAQAVTQAIGQLTAMVQAMQAAMVAPRRLVVDPVTGDPIGSELAVDGGMQ